MGDPKEVIVDISSDEEEGSGRISGVGSGGVGRYDFGWISRFLDEDDESPVDSDDVVVVGEVILNTKQSVKSSVTAYDDSVKAVNEDDCDCIILEEDPDKPVDVNNDVERDDDLLVVSEKGQVACRDYPHPRHHCAKFPFASTPHESFCDQCHCYVCDSLAPCGHWGNGTSSTDHCHASEKEQFWKAERHNKKKNRNVLSSLPPHAVVDASLPVQPPVLHMPPLPQTVQFNMTQNQAFAAQCPIRPCSRQQGTLTPPPGFFVPNRPCSRQHGTLSPPPGFFVPSHPPGYTVPRDNNLQAQNVSHQFQNGFVNRSSNSRRWNVSQVVPRNIQSHTLFKKSGPVPQSVTAHRHGNGSSHVHNRPPYHRNPPRGPRSIDSHGWVTPPITNTGSPGSFPIDLRCIPTNPMPSQSQQSDFLSYISSYPQSFSQSPNYVNPVSSQPCLGRTYTDYVASEFPVLFQQYVDSNSMGKAPPNTHASEHINGVNNIENPMHPRSRQALNNSIPEIDFQSNAGKGSESSAQPLLVGSSCGDTNQLYSSAPIVSQDTSQNISHQGCQIQSVDPDGTLNEPHNVGTAENSFFTTEVNNQLAESPFGFDDWYCEDPTVPRVIEVSVPPGMNVYSPDSAPVGSWSLF